MWVVSLAAIDCESPMNVWSTQYWLRLVLRELYQEYVLKIYETALLVLVIVINDTHLVAVFQMVWALVVSSSVYLHMVVVGEEAYVSSLEESQLNLKYCHLNVNAQINLLLPYWVLSMRQDAVEAVVVAHTTSISWPWRDCKVANMCLVVAHMCLINSVSTRNGNVWIMLMASKVCFGRSRVPYMSPTIQHAPCLCDKLSIDGDAGVVEVALVPWPTILSFV